MAQRQETGRSSPTVWGDDPPGVGARDLPEALFTPFLILLLVARALSPLLLLLAFAITTRAPGLGDRRAVGWLSLAAMAVLAGHILVVAVLRQRDRPPDWLWHPSTMAVDVAVMAMLLLANAAVLPERTVLWEARHVFDAYLVGTAALWTYVRTSRTGVAIVAVGAVTHLASVIVNGYPPEAFLAGKLWVRQAWGLAAVVGVWLVADMMGKAIAEQRAGARRAAQTARERGETAALARAHDEVLPLLSTIVRASEDVERPQVQLERARRLAQQADDVVREGFTRQHAEWGKVHDGVARLVHQCRERQREVARPARVQFFSTDVEPSLSSETRDALLSATEQALRNAEQHADADNITVSIEVDEHEARVVVADDGVGFDPAAISSNRFGVRGAIQGRLLGIGGRANLHTAPGQGCVWELAVNHDPPNRG